MPSPQHVCNGLARPTSFDTEVQIPRLSFVPSGSLSIRGRPPLTTSKLAAYSNIYSPYMIDRNMRWGTSSSQQAEK